eukprot:g5077.t1
MGRKKRKGKRQTQDDVKQPRTMIVSRGRTSTYIKRLKHDLRLVFSPNTGKRIKEQKFNKTRDFLDVCGPLGVSHVLAFFTTDSNTNLKIIKTPQGPTISLRLMSYSLTADVQRAHLRSFDISTGSGMSPLVVLTNFKKTKEHELLTTTLRHLFPDVDPLNTDMSRKRRVVLFDYDAVSDLVRLRHYLISVPVTGLTKAMKSLVYGNSVPDLGDVNELSEFLSRSGYATESEGEEAADSRVELPGGNEPTNRRRVKLKEIGPRLNFTLYKIEQGRLDGLVLYNKFVEKTMEEISANQKRIEETAQLRTMRRKEQERNIERKRKTRDEKEEQNANSVTLVEDDDDVEYYRQQVGVEPDHHFGVKKSAKHL